MMMDDVLKDFNTTYVFTMWVKRSLVPFKEEERTRKSEFAEKTNKCRALMGNILLF